MINANFNERVVVHGAQIPWVDSPMPGVRRRMLDRIGDEVARATSIVEYAPGSHFPAHVHSGGEEFLVLEGVFQDETGDFPVGSYVRNPPTSSHTPRSDEGCVILVKLWQFDPNDRTHVRLRTDKMGHIAESNRAGIQVTPLYTDANEQVQLELWAPGSKSIAAFPSGVELFVLSGEVTERDDVLTPYSWLRIPPGGTMEATAGSRGATLWIKSGHLDEVRAPE